MHAAYSKDPSLKKKSKVCFKLHIIAILLIIQHLIDPTPYLVET